MNLVRNIRTILRDFLTVVGGDCWVDGPFADACFIGKH